MLIAMFVVWPTVRGVALCHGLGETETLLGNSAGWAWVTVLLRA